MCFYCWVTQKILVIVEEAVLEVTCSRAQEECSIPACARDTRVRRNWAGGGHTLEGAKPGPGPRRGPESLQVLSPFRGWDSASWFSFSSEH